MRDFIKGIFKGSPTIWAIIWILITISCILMFSAISSVAYKYTNYLDPFYGHIKHLALGVIMLLIMSRIPYNYLRKLYIVCLPITIIVLIALPYIGGVTLNGGTRALRIGGFDIQPQEFAKLFIIMFLADILTLYQVNTMNDKITAEEKKKKEKVYFWLIIFGVVITCIPIAIQNFSTAVMLCILTFAMMIIGRMDWKKMLGLTAVALLGVGLTLFVLLNLPQEYNQKLPGHTSSIKGRIERSLEDITTPQSEKVYEINDINRQRMHGKIAIANGRVPSGPGNSIQRDYLPLAFSDFIFAILIEESGWIGLLATMACYLSLLFISGTIMHKSTYIYPSLLAIGLTFMVVMQAFISMCVTVGIGPVTGQPLPLISRGGSSIITTCIMLGIVLNISSTITKDDNKKSTEEAKLETENNLEKNEHN